jgi:Flp pilus assembly pilin Flp
MKKLMEKIVGFIKDEEGAVATEYVLLLIFVAIVILVGAKYFAGEVSQKFNDVGNFISKQNATVD